MQEPGEQAEVAHAPDEPAIETAARHMVERVPRGTADENVGTMLAGLAGGEFDTANAVYVLDNDDRLLGIVTLRRLLGEGMQRRLGDIMVSPRGTVLPDVDQELVAFAAIEHDLAEVPVVDEHKRLLGVVPPRALLRIQSREHSEDISRLVGMRRDTEVARHAIEDNAAIRALQRLPWLLVGLVGGGFATWLMATFEAQMQSRIAVAFFIPALVYLAGAVGTQSVSVAVRGLSISRMTLAELTRSELLTGMLIGLALAGLSYPVILFTLGDGRLAIAVCIALVVASTLSTTIGLLLPWTLWKLDMDPALGSGPVATILQDLVSLGAYFLSVALLLA